MKKVEIVEYLNEMGVDIPEGINWLELKELYKTTINTPVVIVEPIDNRTPLEKRREELLPEIKKFMDSMKGKSKATHAELKYMFELYNEYYVRRDNWNCGSCVARVFTIFKKLIKNNK